VQLKITDTSDTTASTSARAPLTYDQFAAVYHVKEADRQAHFRKRKSAQSTTNDDVRVCFAIFFKEINTFFMYLWCTVSDSFAKVIFTVCQGFLT